MRSILVFTQEELHERPQITSMIASLANYSNTIPAAPDATGENGEAKAPPPSARMGKQTASRSTIFCVCSRTIVKAVKYSVKSSIDRAQSEI